MSNAKLTLAKMTGDDLSDATPAPPGEFRQVLGPAPASRGISQPPISDAAQALLIMYGCQAAFVINYWRVTRRNEPGQAPIGVRMRPGQKYRIQTGVSSDASFEEWQKTLLDFVGEQG